jgi:ABC-type dipeptide/oligopeptide/nickel transport system ATPase component
MSMLFITHDLGGRRRDCRSRGRDAQRREIREQGRTAEVFERPRDPYTRALLQCRPQPDRRPRRLPVIDDFLNNDPDSPARRLFGTPAGRGAGGCVFDHSPRRATHRSARAWPVRR